MKKWLPLFLIFAAILTVISCKKCPSTPQSTGQPQRSLNQASLGQAGPSLSLEGTITIDPKLVNNLQTNNTVFIIVKKGPGPPLAVKRVPRAGFPLHYRMTDSDRMFPNVPFAGEVQLLVRVDKDGNAGPAQPGDLEGTSTKSPARVGDHDVDVVINKAY